MNTHKKKTESATQAEDAKHATRKHDEDDDEDEDDFSTFDDEDEEDEEVSWIAWFCSLKGNEFFCEVDEDYISDDFNLCGLSSQIPFYEHALDLILDLENPMEDLTEEQQQMVESAADTLYGLIHARFILTARGIHLMEEKFKQVHFGRCPRVYCQGQACLPVGQYDIAREGSVKIYCPRCNDIYYPRSSRHRGIDGAYWGTTFPHLFLMTLPEHRPLKSTQMYQSRVYGFKVHSSVLQARQAQQQQVTTPPQLVAPTTTNTASTTTTTPPATTTTTTSNKDLNEEDEEEKNRTASNKRKPKIK